MYSYIAVFILFHIFFFICVKKKNLGLIDTAWGLSFIAYHIPAFLQYGSNGVKPLLIGITITLWGLRLAIYLHHRNSGKPEDFRYANMRKGWGEKQNLNAYIRVFWLQAILMFIVSIPSYIAIKQSGEPVWYNYLGLGIWAFGFFWETWADWTLMNFKKTQKGLCQDGPWKYSRHPNYFGEITLWWGIYLMTLPGPVWGIIGPLMITFLVSKVSGVPMLEEKYKDNPEYLEYIRTTNALIPNFFRN